MLDNRTPDLDSDSDPDTLFSSPVRTDPTLDWVAQSFLGRSSRFPIVSTTESQNNTASAQKSHVPSMAAKESFLAIKNFAGDPTDGVRPLTWLRELEKTFVAMGIAEKDWAAKLKMFLEEDSLAEEWYDDLSKEQRSGEWADLSNLFNERFHPRRRRKKTKAQVSYHKWFGERLLALAKGAKIDKTKEGIASAWKRLPYALKKAVGEDYDTWESFTEAIRAVKWSTLRVEAEHEVDLERRKETVPVAQATPRSQLVSSFASTNLSSPPPSPTPNRNRRSDTDFGRSTPRYDSSVDKAALWAAIAAKQPYPDSEEGRRAWEQDIRDWARRFGQNVRFLDQTVMPLAPGMAPVCSGECFRCGRGHRRGDDCTGGSIPKIEGNWRAYCQRILGSENQPARVFHVGDDGDDSWIFEGMSQSGKA
ncbi:hypothetical protein F5880DRAFT_1656186 [Lentinula raphanica]|nr:hypothetical protein F5880DRAFT_1656186 [Lentinula raphanica]